ncbi:Periplasmic dipeptide transport protein precursor [Roseovarius albus]|uniref:Periplasmic dipeptide transport protein n=1 Tax=Roseovarius albus TaxID=1247867 RepID=A0A1X6YZN4_9RHOB|nr:ABC transporter substrate-binding protein [Roseovarius albus]SLN36526.1 Periplasmic dipeptide transport protein precursor [Roseovarius albus]
MKQKQDTLVLGRIVEAGKQRQITRRHFMQHATAAGLSVAAASALWTNEVSAATPEKGGSFRLGVHDGNTSDTMDMGKYQSVGEIQLGHTFRSFLTEITSDNKLGGDMATGWEASPDAKQWTFELAKDASFHDGRPFTAKDAIASLNHHRGEGNTSAAASLLANITDITADGDHSIVIDLDQGFADLPWVLADYHLTMVPAKEDGTAEWETQMGAGPYKIVDHDPGVGTFMERHDGWHREGAYFDKVEHAILNDPNARQTALVSGDVDAITSVDLKTLSLLARAPNVEVENVASGSAITMPMFCDQAPFDDVNVRLALKHAINREDIVEKILFGTGIPGNDFHVSPNMPYWPDIEQRQYDPDKAKWHMKEAGLDSLSVELSAADSVLPGAVDMCVLFSEHAKAAGIDLKAIREPNDGYWSDVWLKKPFVFVKWGARPTPDNMLTLAYKGDAPWNESHWQNERFDELLLQAKAELDETRRAEMYREMCQLSRDDGGTIIPAFLNFVYARSNKVGRGDSLAASWEADGARGSHRWWFTS